MAWFLQTNVIRDFLGPRALLRKRPIQPSLASGVGGSKDRFLRRRADAALGGVKGWSAAIVAAMIAIDLTGSSGLHAQPPQPKPQPIELAGLGQPPESIAALIESGRVRFESGARPAGSSNLRLAAETHYNIAYNYSSRSQWKVTGRNQTLVINVRYTRIEWEPQHAVWFRLQPSLADFWTDRLVLHELDHVRISSDPRLRRRFTELLRERRVLTRSLSNGDVVNREFVDRLVKKHVAEVFAEISDLIAIRYKELDRVTRHGRDPVPGDSPLNEFLQGDDQP